MTMIRQGLAFLAERRASVDVFRREFSDMLLMGLRSHGFAEERGGVLALTDAGRRCLRSA